MKKLLLIEDDQLIANIYRNKFTQDGFKVEVAFDGEVGVDLVKTFRPDVILLDLMLPKIPGIEVLKRIRALPESAKTPVLVFSNTYLSNVVQEAWKAGATKVLSKTNCTPRHVMDAVRAALLVAEGGAPPTAAPQAQVAVPQPAPRSADEEFQAALQKDFIANRIMTLTALREAAKQLAKADQEATRIQHLQGLQQTITSIHGNAAVAGFVHIAQMTEALEILLKELVEKPKNLNVSTIRTVTSAVDFLAFLFDHGINPAKQELPPPKILVVDDEAISRRAVTYALEKAKLTSVDCDDPTKALALLDESKFDLVFLDVDMPGMTGFELCTKIRALPQHKKIPVVFVTSLNDFESRASSTMSGGNDFIGKPFLFIELAVKALMHLLRSRLAPTPAK